MKNSTETGFTLMELLIVIAIITIMASIAFPSYQASVIKTKRTEGKTALFQLMQQEERYMTQNNTYIIFSQASSDPNETKFKWYSNDSASSSSYEIKATACAGDTINNCVMLTATPGTSFVNSSFKDTTCGILTLTSTGIKTYASTDLTGTKNVCW